MTLILGGDGLPDLDLDDQAEGFVCEQWALGPPDIRDVVESRTFADGTIDWTAFVGNRALTMTIVCFPTDTLSVQGQLDRLRAYCSPRRRPTLTWVIASDPPRMVTMRANPGLDMEWSTPSFSWRRVGMSFVVPDSLTWATEDQMREVFPAGTGEVGRRYDEVTTTANLLSANASDIETSAAGWTPMAGATAAQDVVTPAASGVASLALTAASTPTVFAQTSGTPTQQAPVVAGNVYTLMASLRSRAAGRNGWLGVSWYNAAGVLLSSTVGGGTNLLSLDASSFENGVGGWTAVQDTVTPVYTGPLNMLTTEQATMEINVAATAGTRACGWARTGTVTTVDQTTERVLSGSNSLAIRSNTTTTVQVYASNSRATMAYPAVPGNTYTFMAALNPTVVPTNFLLRVEWRDAANAPIANLDQVVSAPPANTWTRLRVSGVAPANAARVQLLISCTGIANNQTVYVDETGWFEGDVPDWHSPADGWARNLLDPERATMETNLIDPTPPGGSCGWRRSTTNNSLEQSTDRAMEGTHSLKSVGLNANANALNTASINVGAIKFYPATPGKAYTFIGHIYTPTGALPVGSQCRCDMQFRAADGTTNVGGLNSADSLVDGNFDRWRPVQNSVICPAGATQFFVQMGTLAGNSTDRIEYHDACAVYEGNVGAWFSPNWVELSAPADAQATHGTHVLAVTRTAPTGNLEARSPSVVATAGRTYTAMLDVGRSNDGQTWMVLEFLDAADAVVDMAPMDAGLVAGAPLTQFTISRLCPAGATKARIRLFADQCPQGTVIKADRAAIFDGAVTNWVPGGQVSADSFTPLTNGAWTQLRWVVTAPAGAAFAMPMVYVDPMAAAEVANLDRAGVFVGDTTQWVVGGGTAVTGRKYDRVYPYSEPVQIVIINPGEVAVPWSARIFGPCAKPKLYNNTSGEGILLTGSGGLTLAAGESVVIDSATRTITQDGSSRYRYLDVVNSDWWALYPGDNAISFEPETFSPGALAEITWRPAWL